MKKINRGVTLVEIAIVLVIIGLLLGGVLKGQELINNAKVRSIADRQNSLKAAWFAFMDRYEAMPGDYVLASQYIPQATNGQGDGFLVEDDSPFVLAHLTQAGYIRCSQCKVSKATKPSAKNSLINRYGGVMAIFHDADYYAYRTAASKGGASPELMIKSGNRLPSNIIAEVDRKIDDGTANEGDFTFSEYVAGGVPNAKSNQPKVLECVSKSTSAQSGPSNKIVAGILYWRHASANPPIESNCGVSNRI